MTRHALVLLVLFIGVSCGGTAAVQCDQNAGCDLNAGGICAAAGTGSRWCAYPDASCASGYRYSTFQVGDGLSGVCLAQEIDAGEPPRPDASPPDGDTAQPPPNAPSCLNIPASCGSAGNENCCDSPLVPGGQYNRSYDVAADGNSGNVNFPATISSFRLDKYEVTVQRFRKFVEAGKGTRANPPEAASGAHPSVTGSGWDSAWNVNLPADTTSLVDQLKCGLDTWTGGNELRPINCITWYEAMAFCIWDGGYLASEAEWNYAAAGGAEQRAYPWSSPASSLVVNPTYSSYVDNQNCVGDNMTGCTLADILPVGTRSPGNARYGQADLGGNIYEWVLDYDGAYPLPCTDCINLTPGSFSFRSYRGGAWDFAPIYMRSGRRQNDGPTIIRNFLGIRCARPAK